MKIISTPDISNWCVKCTCGQCTTVFEADAGDVRYTPSTGGNARDYQPSWFYVECPVCMKQLAIDETDVPHMVQKQAKDRGDVPWDT